MDNRQLKFFLTVCKEKSISKAAAVCFVSQQAISKSIANLEKELGVQLLVRSQSGISLTEAGRMLELKAGQYLREHDDIVNIMRSYRAGRQFRVGFYMGFLQMLPPHFMTDFQKKHPEISLHFQSYTDNDRARDLANRECDLFISTAPVSNSDLMQMLRIEMKTGVIMGRSGPLSEKKSITLDDLAGIPLITLNTENRSLNNLRKALREHGLTVDSVLGDTDWELILDLVGAGFASFYAGKVDVLPENVIFIQLDDLKLYWEFYIYRRKGTWQTAVQEELTADIREALGVGRRDEEVY